MTRRRWKRSAPRETIKIDAEVYALVHRYSQETGVSITRTISEAIRDWMETVGLQRVLNLGGNAEFITREVAQEVQGEDNGQERASVLESRG